MLLQVMLRLVIVLIPVLLMVLVAPRAMLVTGDHAVIIDIVLIIIAIDRTTIPTLTTMVIEMIFLRNKEHVLRCRELVVWTIMFLISIKQNQMILTTNILKILM